MAPESQAMADHDAAACRHRWTAETVERVDALECLAGRIDKRPLFYFEHPQRRRALVACGQAHAIRTSGPGRFAEAAQLVRVLRQGLIGHGPDGPPLVGGFGFSPEPSPSPLWREFPSCWVFLPAEAFVFAEGESTRFVTGTCAAQRAASVTGTPSPGPSAVRSAEDLAAAVQRVDRSASLEFTASAQAGVEHDEGETEEQRWRARVERVLGDIAGGRVSKVVLARSVSGDLGGRADVISILRRLRDARPGCYTFLIAAGDTVFLGSTPELLVRRAGECIETQALAGTVARTTDEHGDAESATALRASDKDAREHREVTRGIIEALDPVTERIEIAEQPRVLEVPEAYHLHTPIRARLRARASVLDLAGLLHPTPAVCGMPRAETARRLAAEEPDRGWYSGAVGWMDFDGDGEFAVALRSALLDRGRYVCWAGAGIVAGSEPDTELAETETKMRAVRLALSQDQP